MSLAAIRSAFETRLASMTPPLETAWENVAFRPTSGVPYQRPSLLPATTQNPALGSSLKVESGIFQVSLFYPANGGWGDIYARAEAIRSYFPRGLTLTSAGTTVLVQRTPSVSAAPMDGDRYVLHVSVPYFAHIF